ncbi:MAG: VOC family protein [Deltaproteobacteria bacterium]|nr:VOC family protein [Deltaproteobacteria bacterium]
MPKTIYSITIAVEDLEEAVKNYESFLGVKPTYSPGYEVLFTECGLKEIGVDYKDQIAVFHLPGIRFILLTGFDKETPIGRFIRWKGEGVFMISMEVNSLKAEEKSLQAKGKRFVFTDNLETHLGTVNMIHPKDMNGVLFELIQTPKNMMKSNKKQWRGEGKNGE